jgi:Na+/H+ antiporter NhaD/arsenite permease-like protein
MNVLVNTLAQTNGINTSRTGGIIMIVVGVVAILVSIGILIFFIYRNKRHHNDKQKTLKVKEKKSRFEIYEFWTKYAYIFLIVVGFVAAVVLIPIGIEVLV